MDLIVYNNSLILPNIRYTHVAQYRQISSIIVKLNLRFDHRGALIGVYSDYPSNLGQIIVIFTSFCSHIRVRSWSYHRQMSVRELSCLTIGGQKIACYDKNRKKEVPFLKS